MAALPESILDHIRHAEGWLRRARSDYERGDAHQAVLRLLLAEAEIRRAREAETRTPGRVHRPPRLRLSRAVLAAAAGLLAIAGYTALRPLVSGPAGSVPGAVRAVPAVYAADRLLQFESGRLLVGFPSGVWPERGSAASVSWGAAGGAGAELIDLVLHVGGNGPPPATLR
jgi:hypothetical protein